MSSRLKTAIITISTLLVAVLLMGAMLGKSASSDGAYRQLQVYTEVLSRIKSDYVEEPDLKSVTLGALTGLLESIDPFSSYLNADQYKEYLKNKDLYKGNVGLVLCRRGGTIAVVDSIVGSPAAKAGLTTFDWIESIKGISTRDMPLAYANLLLQGKPGTTIEISVLSMRHPEPKKLTLTRAVVDYPRPSHKMLPDQIGYIEVESMAPGTANEIAAAVRNLERQGAKKLMLDLRHASSGPPEEGIAVANLFQDKGLLAYLQGQRISRKDFQADPARAITKLPLVVLTNRGTAGGSEVAAAALLESKRAEVVGERTYGDAAVRQSISMDDGGAIILSVAKYYSPSGKAIQDSGVMPSVQVTEVEPQPSEQDEDQPAPEPQPQPSKPDQDPVLKKGIEVLTKGVTAESRTGSTADERPGPASPNDTPLHIPAPKPNR